MNCRFKTALALLASIAVFVAAATGQEEGEPSKAPTKPFAAARFSKGARERLPASAEIKLFSLQNIDANQAKKMLSEIFGDGATRFSADARVNTLVAVGDKDRLAQVEAVLLRLDDAQKGHSDASKTIIFEIRHLPANEILSAIQSLNLEHAKLHVVDQTNTLLVNGSDEAIRRIEELIRAIDARNDISTLDHARIRFVWLVDQSLTAENAVPVPEDLRPAIKQVQDKLGLAELRTAAQMVVDVGNVNSRPFNAVGTAKIQGTLCRVRVEGVLDARRGQLEISGSATGDGANQDLCRLSTAIKLKPDHPVVFGMTTVDSKASLFVVELLSNLGEGDGK